MYQYIVHLNYGSTRSTNGHYTIALHLVRCPSGAGKILTKEQLKAFLVGKPWRDAV
jgi:hypothetical protein